MGRSFVPGLLGRGEVGLGVVIAPRTCGPLGVNDQGDPSVWSWAGDTPGPVGYNDLADPRRGFGLDGPATALLVLEPAGPAQAQDRDTEASLLQAQQDPDFVRLATVGFGEAGTGDVYEEMAAIASVIVRQAEARGQTLAALLGPKGALEVGANDGNPRVAFFRKASQADRLGHPGLRAALRAARNALDGGQDYSNGAYFWDGANLKTDYASHPKVKLGIRFSRPEHNIYAIRESSVDETGRGNVKNKEGVRLDGDTRGNYTYTYESTAAHGRTIFWKYGDSFLKATGNAPHD